MFSAPKLSGVVPNAWGTEVLKMWLTGTQGVFKRGINEKFQNFELGIEIYVEKSKEFSGAIRF